MPQGARFIIEQLNKNGYEACIVGGCVRDSLLGKIPNDWDITTSAKPQDVKRIFRRTVDTGIQHGTVTVLVDKDAFEVTTYRVDGVYEDHRRPREVAFTANLEEDLKRRDFTINAMAYNDTDGVIDVVTLVHKAGLVTSKSDGRRAVEQGGVTVDGEKVGDIKQTFTVGQFAGEGLVVKRGKKNFRRVVVE